MAEMIIPGTYVDVLTEGLISAGRIATGVVGVIGTAASGPIDVPLTLASFSQARDIFGLPDVAARPDDGANPLTLVRALQYIYNNGASSVIAVRVAGGSAASATFTLTDASSPALSVAVLTAATPGTWANDMRVAVDEADQDSHVSETQTSGFSRLRYTRVVISAENHIRITRGDTRRVDSPVIIYKRVVTDEAVRLAADGRFILSARPIEQVAPINTVTVLAADGSTVRSYRDTHILYGAGAAPAAGEIRIDTATGIVTFEASQVPTAAQRVVATYAAGSPAPTAGQVLVTVWDGSLQFATGESPNQDNGDKLTADYLVDRANSVKVTLTAGAVVERYIVPDGIMLAARINDASKLVTAAVDGANGGRLPKTGVSAFFGAGSNTRGSNGADAGDDDYAAGLEAISNMIVNIVHLAGQDTRMGSTLAGHLNSTQETDHERIGVIGASGTTATEILGHEVSSDRIVLVAPGLRLSDGSTLPAAYAAAAIAGIISSLPVQTSLTNKVINVPGLALDFNRGQQEQLISRNVLTIVSKEGFRVVKGITTSGEGTPFRRIVDFAKYGVRSAANSYIGRLNNSRVRAALKATLDAFLTRMVESEALTAYELEVSATRPQEIAGEVSVVMTLQPTFSIDFIRVTMILK
jgi:tail sheath protein